MTNKLLKDHLEEAKSMFGLGYSAFRERVVGSFKMVKEDMNLLKDNIAEWIMFLDSNQRKHDSKIQELEKRIEMLESQLKKQKIVNI